MFGWINYELLKWLKLKLRVTNLQRSLTQQLSDSLRESLVPQEILRLVDEWVDILSSQYVLVYSLPRLNLSNHLLKSIVWLDRFPQKSTQCNDGWPGPHSLSNMIHSTCAIISSLGSMYSVFYWHLIVVRLSLYLYYCMLPHVWRICLHCQHDLLTTW